MTMLKNFKQSKAAVRKAKAAAGKAGGTIGGRSRSKAKLSALASARRVRATRQRDPAIAALMKKEGLTRQAAWYRLRKGKTKVTK
jgi:hypothetical protein